jgi:cytochrome P450
MEASNAQTLSNVPAHVAAERIVDLDIYATPGGETDSIRPWLALRDSTSFKMVWSPRNGGHWITLDSEQIPKILADSDRFSSEVMVLPREMSEATKLIPVQSDPPEHTHYRAIIAKEMGAKYIMALKEPLEEVATMLIERFRGRGKCEFVADFSSQFPVYVFFVLAGLPREDAQKLHDHATQMTRPDGSITPEQFISVLDDYLAPRVLDRLKNPGEDLLSRVISKPVNGRPMTIEEANRICRTLLLGGLDTVTSLMGFVALFLAGHPEYQEQLRANPRIVPAAADELLRRFPFLVLARVARCDMEFDGVTVKRNEIVMVPTMLHNLDPNLFDDPNDVRFDRGLKAHSTMGNGIHRCVGASLARAELIAFLDVWHKLMPTVRVDPHDKVVHRSGAANAISYLPLVWEV